MKRRSGEPPVAVQARRLRNKTSLGSKAAVASRARVASHRPFRHCVARFLSEWRWRHARDDDHDFCPLAGRAIENKPAAQAISNDTVDDMQAEAGASIATCGEERIERFPPDIETHAAAIVAKNNFDMVTPGRPHVDINGTFLAVGKSVRNRVEEEVGQHLSIWPGITVHRQIGLAFDL